MAPRTIDCLLQIVANQQVEIGKLSREVLKQANLYDGAKARIETWQESAKAHKAIAEGFKEDNKLLTDENNQYRKTMGIFATSTSIKALKAIELYKENM